MNYLRKMVMKNTFFWKKKKYFYFVTAVPTKWMSLLNRIWTIFQCKIFHMSTRQGNWFFILPESFLWNKINLYSIFFFTFYRLSASWNRCIQNIFIFFWENNLVSSYYQWRLPSKNLEFYIYFKSYIYRKNQP